MPCVAYQLENGPRARHSMRDTGWMWIGFGTKTMSLFSLDSLGCLVDCRRSTELSWKLLGILELTIAPRLMHTELRR